jgi:predicted dehydrogenase
LKKVAVIGLGNIAVRHRRNLRQLFPDVILYAMSSRGRTPIEDVSDGNIVVTSIDELIIAKVELVIIASPATFHAEQAVRFIKAGIPTLIEKPVTADVKDAALLNRAIHAIRTPVAVSYCLRYLPSAMKVKMLLEEEYVGKLHNVFINVGQYLPDWRPNKDYRESVSVSKKLGGGALLELSHELDYAQWLLGNCVVEHAILRSSEELGLEVEDIADVILRSDEGVVVNIHLDFVQRSVQRHCSLIGSKGRLDWNLITNSVTFYGALGSEVLYSEPTWDKNEMYVSVIKDFIGMAKGRHNQCVELDMAIKTVKLVEGIKFNSGKRLE